jgi:hypothetical protein
MIALNPRFANLVRTYRGYDIHRRFDEPHAAYRSVMTGPNIAPHCSHLSYHGQTSSIHRLLVRIIFIEARPASSVACTARFRGNQRTVCLSTGLREINTTAARENVMDAFELQDLLLDSLWNNDGLRYDDQIRSFALFKTLAC